MTGERHGGHAGSCAGGRPAALRRLALLLAMLGTVATVRGQEGRPRVETSLEREQCYEGESVLYTVDVRDVRDAEPPDLSALRDFDVRDLGSKSLDSMSMQIVNGRVTRSETYGVRFHYLLTPRRVGRLEIPAIVVRADGRELAGPLQALAVASPDAQDSALLAIEVAPKQVYPEQPFTVRLRIFLKRVPGEWHVRDPLALLFQLERPPVPMLKIPWDVLPDGLVAPPDDRWLDAHVARGRRGETRSGFHVNEKSLGGDPAFAFDSMFGGPRYALFDFGGRAAEAADVAGLPAIAERAGDYFTWTLERRLIARRVGTYAFGPATLKGSLIESVERRQVALKEVFAVGRAVHLEVREPPLEGRPAGYTGGVGAFALDATVAPARCHVGDPLTFTVRVTGQGNVDELAPVDLTQIPAFVDRFRIYEASAETKGGARSFTWSLRPLATSVTAVPPLPIAWFDPEREEYVSRATKELPIEVLEAERLDPGAIVGDRAGGRTDAGGRLAARSEGLFANDTDPRHVLDERIVWQRHALAALLLPAAGLLLGRGLVRARERRADPKAQRRRSASARARARLQEAAAAAARGDPLATTAALRAALVGLIADGADRTEAALTPREAADALRALTGAGDLADRSRGALEGWHALAYAGGPGSARDLEVLVMEGRTLVDEVAAALACGGHLA